MNKLQDEMRKEYAKIIAKAWADEDFKKNLLSNPRRVLKDEGVEIPDQIKINIFENTENIFNFVLPAKPDNLPDILDIEKRIAGVTCIKASGSYQSS